MSTAPTAPVDAAADFKLAWEQWHQAHEEARADRHGFLAVTSINWLDENPRRLDDAPGEWWSDAGGAHVALSGLEEITVDGAPVSGRYDVGILPERGGLTVGWHDAVIEIARRGGRDIVRPRHPDNALLAGYTGTPTFEPSPAWAVPGRYVAFTEPRATTVGSVVDGLEHVYVAPGKVEFELDGEALALTVFPGHTPGSLFVLFTDATSGVTTYGANRSLAVATPRADGSVVLDFNRATNLPCAYTDLATCPLPPAGNHLPVAVEAGEKLPIERGGHR